MGYKNSRATMKRWYPHTKKLKYYSSAEFDENNNKFGKGWSPGFELRIGINIFTLPTLKIDLSYHYFIKYDIFEVNVNLIPGGTTTGIVTQYFEHKNMS